MVADCRAYLARGLQPVQSQRLLCRRKLFLKNSKDFVAAGWHGAKRNKFRVSDARRFILTIKHGVFSHFFPYARIPAQTAFPRPCFSCRKGVRDPPFHTSAIQQSSMPMLAGEFFGSLTLSHRTIRERLICLLTRERKYRCWHCDLDFLHNSPNPTSRATSCLRSTKTRFRPSGAPFRGARARGPRKFRRFRAPGAVRAKTQRNVNVYAGSELLSQHLRCVKMRHFSAFWGHKGGDGPLWTAPGLRAKIYNGLKTASARRRTLSVKDKTLVLRVRAVRKRDTERNSSITDRGCRLGCHVNPSGTARARSGTDDTSRDRRGRSGVVAGDDQTDTSSVPEIDYLGHKPPEDIWFWRFGTHPVQQQMRASTGGDSHFIPCVRRPEGGSKAGRNYLPYEALQSGGLSEYRAQI